MCVEIHVTAGPARGQSFLFEKPGRLLFGRALDAHISVSDDPYVSRHHFELHVKPPTCMLRDLNSINGVFINGVHYGGQSSLSADSTQAPPFTREIYLDDGDEIVVRETRISVSIRSTAEQESRTQILTSSKHSLADSDVALLLLKVPHAAPRESSESETLFSSHIGYILTQIKRHPASAELLFLKYLDKGFLMAFSQASDAFALASTLLDHPSYENEYIQIALHWGTVRTRPNGDVFGREVHRIYRIESIQLQKPGQNYLLITQEGLAQLGAPEQQYFRSVGAFQLEGFDEECELWMLQLPSQGHHK